MYDVAVKWRQYSEPNDPVWWIDLLAPEQFAEGFGSQTPMVRFHCGHLSVFVCVCVLIGGSVWR